MNKPYDPQDPHDRRHGHMIRARILANRLERLTVELRSSMSHPTAIVRAYDEAIFAAAEYFAELDRDMIGEVRSVVQADMAAFMERAARKREQARERHDQIAMRDSRALPAIRAAKPARAPRPTQATPKRRKSA